jgi:uncharacterized protein YaaR (DUF327 family)
VQVKLNSAKPVERRRGRTAAVDARRREFDEALRDSEAERRRRVCQQLLEEIDGLSAELKKAPNPEGIRRYRDLVTSFMKEALHQSFEVNQQTHWDRTGNRKTMTTVKQINKLLEEIMDETVNKEKRHLDLIAKFDQIRGLLLDLYL